MDDVELVNLERLAYILKGLGRAELETLYWMKKLPGISVNLLRN